MSPFRQSIVALSLLGCAQASGPTEEGQHAVAPIEMPSMMASLAVGDTLEVHYRSKGCFHDVMATLIFARLPEGVQVTITTAADPIVPAGRKVQFLTTEAVAALDVELAAVRSLQEGFCTTQTDYGLTWIRAGAAVTDPLHDGSCVLSQRYYYQNIPLPLTSFGELVWKTREPLIPPSSDG